MGLMEGFPRLDSNPQITEMLVEGFLQNLKESLGGNAEVRIDGVALACPFLLRIKLSTVIL